MINRFHYWDLIIQDTPIYDLQQFEVLKASFPPANEHGSRHIQYRVPNVRQFIKYLKTMEQKQPVQIHAVYGNTMEGISQHIEVEIGQMHLYNFAN